MTWPGPPNAVGSRATLSVQKGKTASLAVRVPTIDMRQGVQAQIAEIEEALKTVYRLVPYATLFQTNE